MARRTLFAVPPAVEGAKIPHAVYGKIVRLCIFVVASVRSGVNTEAYTTGRRQIRAIVVSQSLLGYTGTSYGHVIQGLTTRFVCACARV